MQLYDQHCGALHLLEPAHYTALINSEDGIMADAKDAALYFLVAAHPDGKSIFESYDKYRSKIYSRFETYPFHGKGFRTELLVNLPGTKSPVKALPTYIQTPCTDSCVDGQLSVLNFVWRLEVEMQDNWYEAYVDAFSPTRIMKVVDWASDAKPKCIVNESGFAPIPKTPKQDENGITESTYSVWPWGINDPAEGSRDIVKNPYDFTASPIGWHSIPKGNDPSYDPFLVGKKDELRNFTTTWGNNVHAQENWKDNNSWRDNQRPEGHDNLTFVFPYGAEQDKENVDPKTYINLTVTQLF